jgi:DNA polymerase-3 subunit epsilon
MREIILDTETTGFEPKEGHRMTEIGALEVINYLPTGKTYQQYINPERDVPIESVNVTGLTEEFLRDFPTFTEITSDFLDFIGDSPLVIHNADFDMNFLNHQLGLCGFKPLQNKVVDTLTIARQKFPGAPASLDALCRRFDIDNSNREKHGALLDSELLADVYIELMGGRQRGFDLSNQTETAKTVSSSSSQTEQVKIDFPHRTFDIPEDELTAHNKMINKITDPIWIDKK